MGQQRRRWQFHVMELFLLALLASSAVSGSRLLEDAVDDEYEEPPPALATSEDGTPEQVMVAYYPHDGPPHHHHRQRRCRRGSVPCICPVHLHLCGPHRHKCVCCCATPTPPPPAVKCAGPLPAVVNGTWDPACLANGGSAVGTTCNASCTPPTVQTAPITSNCTLEGAWSNVTAGAVCGVLRTEALLEFQATTPDGSCTLAATEAVKSSVETFMTAQPDVTGLQVTVICYNANGTQGAVARVAWTTADGLMQDALLLDDEVLQLGDFRQADAVVRFAVLVIYLGPQTAGDDLLTTAISDPNAVGNLVDNVANATNSNTTILPNGTTGSVSGGETPINPETDVRLSLLRTGTTNLPVNTTFFLTAAFTAGLVPQADVVITGPVITPPGSVTCLPSNLTSLTDSSGTVQWTCTTGPTAPSGPVNMSVSTLRASASLSFNMSTDCVGDFVGVTACSNVCGNGTRTKTFQITTRAANGGLECAFSDGQVVTEDCTGPVVCDVDAACTNATAPPAFGCVCNAGLEGNGLPGNCTTAVSATGTRFLHASCINPPSTPSEPAAFTGTLRTVGSSGTFATLALAVAASAAGDRIQVLTGTTNEAAQVVVDKSLEIFGTGATCIVSRSSLEPVIKITAGDVFVHDLAVVNAQPPKPDGGGQSSCITASTMVEGVSEQGLPGIYITRCSFTFPKLGVSIDGASWVVRDCTFTPNLAFPDATIRAMAPYGCTGSCHVAGNTFLTPTTPDPTGRLIAVAINAAGPRGAYFVTGYKGNLSITDNSIVSSGAAPRAYIDTTGMFRQPGNLNTLGNNGEFNFYLYRNNFAVNYTSSPCLFFASAGAYLPAVNRVQAFGFFNVLAVRDNTFGARTTGAQKGGVFFDAFTVAPVPVPELGTFATGFFAQNNVFSTPGVPIDAAYVAASRLPGLLVVDPANFFTPVPQPPLTPAAPGPAAGLLVVDSVQVADGDRVFAEDTCDAVNGGVFVASSTIWPRAPTGPFAAGQDAAGAKIVVAQGFMFGNTTWQCDNAPGAGVVGTDALNFTQLT